MDRLIDAIAKSGNPSVVGLDPKPALLPEPLLHLAREAGPENQAEALAEAYACFNKAIIDAVSDVVPAVKPQIAMYEALGVAGLHAYVRTTAYAQQKGLYVLGDVKRGDIGSTAAAYASHLSGLPDFGQTLTSSAAADQWHEDAVTVNPYLGTDGIEPFVTAASATDKDLFVLVRTSNPSSSELQNLDVAEQGSAAAPQHAPITIADRVGSLVEQWGESTRGKYGYSRVGAVVGATHPEDGRRLRAELPHTFFLVPGFGAQGGSAADVAEMFDREGRGAIINSSRGIIGAWAKDPESQNLSSNSSALDCVARNARAAALEMKKSIVMELEKKRGN
jgi:orotidine-5'-phosphate decarboxylase